MALPLRVGKTSEGELLLDLSRGFSIVLQLPGEHAVRLTVEPLEVETPPPVAVKEPDLPTKRTRKTRKSRVDTILEDL